jgi:hypothetical protein
MRGGLLQVIVAQTEACCLSGWQPTDEFKGTPYLFCRWGVWFVQEITLQAGIEFALDSLLNDRLALLCGAGLSMAPPSCLPAAAALAARAKQIYDARYGSGREPLPAGVEEQAEFFFSRNELATVYFRHLIDPNAFAGQPNPGHHAIADFLLVRGIQTAVTTNVDTLIETAGQLLLGQVGMGIDGNGVAALSPDIAPLLKIHGCRTCDPDNMVWAPSQIEVEPVAGWILSSEGWLRVRLLDRDLSGAIDGDGHLLAGQLIRLALHPARLRSGHQLPPKHDEGDPHPDGRIAALSTPGYVPITYR